MHNQANGENNRDGHSDNLSCNHGVEGATEDKSILALRLRQIKNMLATLMLSQGVPMLLAGDELGRSQQGNNNAYCQDNALNWLNWDEDDLYADELKSFVACLTELRKRFPMLAHDRFIHKDDNNSTVDITWFHPSGFAMQKEQWHCHHASTLGYLITQKTLTESRHDITNNIVSMPAMLSLFHAGEEPIEFQLPDIDAIEYWQVMIDTTVSNELHEGRKIPAERKVTMKPFSTIFLLSDCL